MVVADGGQSEVSSCGGAREELFWNVTGSHASGVNKFARDHHCPRVQIVRGLDGEVLGAAGRKAVALKPVANHNKSVHSLPVLVLSIVGVSQHKVSGGG